jgi:predicted nucleotidyltransferase
LAAAARAEAAQAEVGDPNLDRIDMTPEDLASRCRKLMPHGLRSVILYGSSVAGDFVPGRSDYNVLLIFERLGLGELRLLAPIARDWQPGAALVYAR